MTSSSFYYTNPTSGTVQDVDGLVDEATNAASQAQASAASAAASATSATASKNQAVFSASEAGNASSMAVNAAASATASANTASTAATNAAASATTASSAAANIATAAETTLNNASQAVTAAANASASATSAQTSAASAQTSATTATTKATEASTSAATATTKAAEAAASATSAQTSATNAANSATSANTSATSASSSASAASTSATAAATARAAAEQARDSTLAAFDSFDDRYLGAKSIEPTVDNDGNPLVAGTLYFDTLSQGMKVYTGSAWVSAYVSGTGFVLKSGDTMTGMLTLAADATSPLHAITKQQFDSAVSSKADATHTHVIADVTNLQTSLDAKLNKAGDTMTGALTLSGDATSALHAVTKQQLDTGLGGKANTSHTHSISDVTSLQTSLDAKLDKSGGTLTGALDLGSNTLSAGAASVSTLSTTGNIGVGVATATARLDLSGNMAQNIVNALSTPGFINCSLGNYFIDAISDNVTYSFINAPASRAYSFTLELAHNSGTVTWPIAVQWPGGTAPSLTAGKTHLFMFITDDGGTRWRGASLADYTT